MSTLGASVLAAAGDGAELDVIALGWTGPRLARGSGSCTRLAGCPTELAGTGDLPTELAGCREEEGGSAASASDGAVGLILSVSQSPGDGDVVGGLGACGRDSCVSPPLAPVLAGVAAGVACETVV